MCGIIGGNYSDANAAEKLGLSMLEQIRYRGPDGGYLHIDQSFFLGTRRLAIINLENGRQPVTSEDNQIIAVFNGEIYNHRELKAELQKDGYPIRDGSDAEVIPHAYLKWGSDFPSHFNGDFAIALFDKRKQQWLLVRDRLGIKPLYYTQTKDGLLFGSEIKNLFCHTDVQRELDPKFLSQQFTYWTGIEGGSPFKNIHQVETGTVLTLSKDGNPLESYKYWDIPYQQTVPNYTDDFQTCQEQFRHEMKKSVGLRLQADVEVGTYTSGGIDSAVVNVAAHKDLNHSQTRTFSVAFEDEAYDESPYQKMMANHLGLQSSEVRCQYSDIYNNLANVVHHTEAPIFRTAPVPMYLLSQCVNTTGVKVVLTGEGADEVAWGYDIFREAKIRRFWSRQPESPTRPKLFQKLYAYLPQFQDKRHFNLLVDFFKQDMHLTDAPLYSHHMRIGNAKPMRSFLSESMTDQIADSCPEEDLIASLPENFSDRSLLEKCQYLEMRTLLHGYLLSSQGDRMLSAHSVEGRFPFLDHNVIEFLAGIPENYRLRSMKDKAILREAYRKDLPEEIFNRPKFAFRAPELTAFLEDRSGMIAQHLQPDAIEAAGIFNQKAVKQFLYRMENTPIDRFATRDNLVFVQLITTQLLHQQMVIDFEPVQPPKSNDVTITRAY